MKSSNPKASQKGKRVAIFRTTPGGVTVDQMARRAKYRPRETIRTTDNFQEPMRFQAGDLRARTLEVNLTHIEDVGAPFHDDIDAPKRNQDTAYGENQCPCQFSSFPTMGDPQVQDHAVDQPG